MYTIFYVALTCLPIMAAGSPLVKCIAAVYFGSAVIILESLVAESNRQR